MLALRWASTSRSAGEPGRGHIRGSAWAPQISAARCGSGATAAVVTKLIILELRIPAGLDERFEFSGQIPEASGADNGLSRDLHGPSGRGTAWRSPAGGRLAAARNQYGARSSDQSHGGLRQASWAPMPRREPYPLRQIIGDSRRGPVPAPAYRAFDRRPACDNECGHAIEAGLAPACGSSRRQRAVDLESARPRQETNTDTVLLQALVTKLVLVRGSVATPTEQPPVRTRAATVFVRPLITTVSSSPLAT